MDKKQILEYVVSAKEGAVKLMLFDAASALRSIENTYKGQFGAISTNPTINNLKDFLERYIERISDIKDKDYLIMILRDIKLHLLIE